MSSRLIDYFISDKILGLKLDGGLGASIPLKRLRKACPCAHCNGEKDVFGNIYKGPDSVLSQSSIKILKISLVGQYAIRVFWKDGHSSGIYTFDLLKALYE